MDNDNSRGEGGGEDGQGWEITVNLSIIDLSHKRIGIDKEKGRGFRKGWEERDKVLNGTLQGVLNY